MRIGRGNLELLLVTVIWGVNSIGVKDALGVFLPLQFNVVRLMLSAALLLAVMASSGKMEYPAKKERLPVLIAGFLSNTLYQLAFIKGIAMSTASNTSFVLATMPATTAVLSHLTGRQRMTSRMSVGVLMTVVGVLLVSAVGSGALSTSSDVLRGDLITLIGTLGFCIGTIYAADLTKTMSPIAYTTWTMVTGAFLMIPFSISELRAANWGDVGVRHWGELVFSGTFALVLSYILWNKGVKESGPAKTAIFGNLTPVWTGLFGRLILKEGWTPAKFLGAAVILGGVTLVRFGGAPTPGDAADSRRKGIQT